MTTIAAEDIAQISPQSTADLFKSIPGVWAESSGGIAGANIDVRGLPGGGDAPFVTLAINGTPLYGTEMLSFFEQSSIFRIDETVASVEGLRGGPNAVFGKGEPGLTVNFNLWEGSDETEGRVKYSTSDYDLQRLDGRLSGALADDFYYMIGGYITSSPGIRDTQFSAEEGKQFTINLTRDFDAGKVNLFTRLTDDHGQWVLPMALNSGLDLGNFAQLGNATRFREIQTNAAGDTQIFDFAKGRGWDGMVSGGSAEFDVGDGFTIRDQFTYMERRRRHLRVRTQRRSSDGRRRERGDRPAGHDGERHDARGGRIRPDLRALGRAEGPRGVHQRHQHQQGVPRQPRRHVRLLSGDLVVGRFLAARQ